MVPSFLRELLSRGATLRSRRRHRGRRRDACVMLETLEDRLTPATLDITGGLLTYTAGSGVSNVLTLSVAGGNYTFNDVGETITLTGPGTAGWSGGGSNTVSGPDSSVNAITVDLGDQSDTANIRSINDPTMILGGLGDDTINVSSNAPANTGNLAGIAADLTIDAGGGSNTLVVSDFGASTGNGNVQVNAGAILNFAGPGDGTAITYAASGGSFGLVRVIGSNSPTLAEQFTVNGPGGPLTLDANAGNDVINVRSLAFPATIRGGAGNDAIHVSSDAPADLGNLDGIEGALSIDAGTGVNTLTVSDFGQTVTPNTNVGVTNNTISGFAGSLNNRTITYQALGGSFSSVALLGSNTLADTFNVTANAKVNLFGGGGDDSFNLLNTAVVNGTIDGGTGTDTLSYAGYTNPVNVTPNGAGADGYFSTTSPGVSAFNNIDAVIGSAGADTLTGENVASTWTLDATQTYFDGNSFGKTLTFSGFETLQGGTSVDTFNVSSLTSAITINGGDGSDVVTVTQSGLAADLSVSDSGASGTDVLTSNTANAGPESIGVTPTQVTRTASGTIAYAGIETLNVNGSAGSTGVFPSLAGDVFTVTPSPTTTYNIDGSTPTPPNTPGDKLIYQGGGGFVSDNGAVLHQTGFQDVNYVGIETVVIVNSTVTITGTSGDDTLTVNATGPADGSYVLNGGPTVFFGSITSFTFDSDGGNDTFTINNPSGGLFAPSGGITYLAGAGTGDVLNLAGGAGFNETYDLGNAGALAGPNALGAGTLTTTDAPTPTATQVITFTGLEGPITDATPIANLLTVNATDEANNIALADGPAGFDTASVDNGAGGNYAPLTFQNKNAVTINADAAGAFDDTINVQYTTAAAGLNGPVVINGSGGNDTFNIQANTPNGVATNLNGDAGADSFVFSDAKVLTGSIDGGGQLDTLDWSSYTTPRVVTLTGAGATDGFTGTVASLTGTFTNIDSVLGTAGSDQIVDNVSADALWNITNNNFGNVVQAGATLSFNGFENLTGANANDTFRLSDSVGLSGFIDGRAGNDTLDYSLYTTGIVVNLPAGTATNVAGGLVAGAAGDPGSSIENVFGGAGDDNLIGDQDNNILADGLGSDTLTGNDANDTFRLTPGPAGSADSLFDSSGNDTVDFSLASAGVTFNMDPLNVPQTVFGTSTVQLNGPTIGPSPFENFLGSAFNDTVTIKALPVVRNVDGNAPASGDAGVPPGDTMILDAQGQPVNDTGFSVTAQGVGTATYQSIETLTLATQGARVLDDGDAGFSLQGSWSSQAGGFQGDVHFPVTAGQAGDAANWTFDSLQPGQYRVSATWPTQSNLATNAPYTMLDGTVALATVTVNQMIAPADFTASGVGWKDLGTFTVNNHRLVVRLNGGPANGFVFADAIRVERITNPDIELYAGSQLIASAVDLGITGLGQPVVKTLTIKNLGAANLIVSSISLPAGFTTTFADTTVGAGQSYVFNIGLAATAVQDVSGLIRITTNDVDENPFVFTANGSVTVRKVVDNSDASFSTVGPWVLATGQGYQGTVRFIAAGSGANTATWTFTGLQAGGSFRVSATWSPFSNRATNAPFTVSGGTSPTTVPVNEQLTPNDFQDLGVGWKDLVSSYTITGTTLTVRLSDLANNFVIADAIRIEQVGDPHLNVTVGAASVPDDTGAVDFGATPQGVSVSKTFTITNTSATLDATLTGPITLPAGFSLDPASAFGTGSSPVTLPHGASITFTVTMNAAEAGAVGGTLSFGTGTLDQNPYNFQLTGIVNSIAFIDPTIQVLDGATTLTSGSSTVDFGTASFGGPAVTKTFTINNLGQRALALGTPVLPVGFTSPGLPSQSIPPGGSILFSITLPTTVADHFLGTLTLPADDLTNSLFTITLTGNVTGAPTDAPEIQLLNGAADVPGGSTLSFGAIDKNVPNVPAVQSLTIANTGSQPLQLTSLRLPPGYSVFGFSTPMTLAAGTSTPLTLFLDSLVAGNHTGTLVLGTNDDDENPFVLTLTGVVNAAKIQNDSGPGFTTTAGWSTATGGFQNGIHFHAAGTASDTATWTFTGLPAGTYRVSATWTPAANRATNAPYTVFNGASAYPTVLVNQQLAPDDFNDNGVFWEDLGGTTYVLTGGNNLVVRLAANANGVVIADAIRVERVFDPDIQVLSGTTNLESGLGSVNFGTAVLGGPVQQSITVKNVGTQPLVLTSVALPLGFSVAGGFTATTLNPGDTTAIPLQLDAAQAGSFAGVASIGTNDPDESPFTFNVSGTVQTAVIIDDTAATFTGSPAWSFFTNQGFNGNVHARASTDPAGTATWTFTNLPAGTYRVSATWTPFSNRATNAPYTVFDGPNAYPTVSMNQQLAPNDFTDQGGAWEDLGGSLYQLTAGNNLIVRLTNAGANNFVIADAIRVERILDPYTQVLQAGTNIEFNETTVSFGTTQSGTPVQKTFTVKNVGPATLNLGTISLPTGYSLVSTFGQSSLTQGQSTTFTVQLDAASSGTFAGNLSFVTNDPRHNPFIFPITGTVGGVFYIDDSAPSGFVATPSNSWTAAFGQGVNNTVRFAAAGNGSATATWTFTSLAAGTYRVSATWTAFNNRATNAPYTVNGTGGSTVNVTENQQLPPASFMENGVLFQDLSAAYAITGGTITVTLSNFANGFVIADEIRVERLGPQMAAGGEKVGGSASTLTNAQLQPIVNEAIARWDASGAAPAGVNLAAIPIQIVDLPNAWLGGEATNSIMIDANAAGYGWFIDPTPRDDREFTRQAAGTERDAVAGAATGHMDLLTVVMHEFGHILGLGDVDPASHPGDLMAETLTTGARRGPAALSVITTNTVQPKTDAGALLAASRRGSQSPSAATQEIAPWSLGDSDAYFLWLAQHSKQK
jgi:hypothetical protein